MTGQVTIKGLTITLTSDAGMTTVHTFLPVAGTPVSAFSVDADMFTRVGPPPAAAVAPPPSPSAGGAGPPPAGPAVPATSYQWLSFSAPSGWTSATQGGHFLLTPASTSPDSVAIVVLSGAEALGARSLDDWLVAKMAADLSGGLRPLQSAPPTRGRMGGLDTLSVGRTVQDASGGVILQIYHAISNGQLAGLAMAATATEAAMKTHIKGVQAIFQSLRLPVTLQATAPTPSSTAAPTATGQKAEIATADVGGDWGAPPGRVTWPT